MYHKGFTLIELLVTISIISLLSSTVIASTNEARNKAARSAFVQDLTGVRTALVIYRTNHDTVPHCTALPCTFLPSMLAPLVTEKIISKIPDTGPGLSFEPLYWTGMYIPNYSIDERVCGANTITPANWTPGTLPGVITFAHEDNLEYGLSHSFTQCSTFGGTKTCQVTGPYTWLSCMPLY
jgi:prepilin-type N-terminal cleavage/methylation domain-containing protein